MKCLRDHVKKMRGNRSQVFRNLSYTVATENDVGQRTVHGFAHDVGKDSAGRADQSTDNGHQIVVQHEAFGAKGPARIAVEHGNDYRHISSSDGGGQSDTHDGGKGRGRSQHGHAGRERRIVEIVAHGTNVA